MKRKNLSDQVVAITGASSGIGLATARRAARAGARLVLLARSEEGLKQVCEEIARDGGTAVYFVVDVADEAALRSAADFAIQTFGRIAFASG